MARRKVQLSTGAIYHILNRGIEHRDIFIDSSDYLNFLSVVKHYLAFPHRRFSTIKRLLRSGSVTKAQLDKERIKEPLVGIVNLCLLPNHFHLTIRQNLTDGISRFMQLVGNSHAHYFNTKYKRTGSLFESRFKAVLVETDEQLIHLSRYVHLNPIRYPEIDLPIDAPEKFPWSSLSYYLSGKDGLFNFCKKEIVTSFFKDSNEYKDFLLSEIKKRDKDLIRELVIDNDFGWEL